MKKYVLCTQSEQYRAADLYDALESYEQDTLYKRKIIQITMQDNTIMNSQDNSHIVLALCKVSTRYVELFNEGSITPV